MSIPLLDCHQHLINPDRYPYSWTDQIPQLAGQTFAYEDYLELIGGQAEVRTLFMETSPDDPHWQEESRLAIDLAAASDTIVDGVILNCRPEADEDFGAFLESIHHPRLVGLRRILHVVPDEMSQQPRFISNLQLLAQYRLTFDLCFLARQLPLAHQLASRCPDVQFVLDHCGVPDIAGGVLDPWREHIQAIAELPNVACKISGVLAYCSPGNATAEAVRPYVEHCIEQFGWDRVVWGSDWPVVCMTSGLLEWIQITRELLATESQSNQHKLLHRNAERIYLKRQHFSRVK